VLPVPSEIKLSYEVTTHVSRWLAGRDMARPSILVAEPLAMQEGLVSEGWVANCRTNIKSILTGKGFKDIEFLPEPFAVYQYSICRLGYVCETFKENPC
jgi:hypothetical protein